MEDAGERRRKPKVTDKWFQQIKMCRSGRALLLSPDPGMTERGQYMQDLQEAIREKPLGPGVFDVAIRHDNWCRLLSGKGACNCNPDIEIAEWKAA